MPQLALLGRIQVTLDGLPAKGLSSDRLRALLGYLAVEGRREHPSEQPLGLAPSQASGQAQGGDRRSLMLEHWALGHSHWMQWQFVSAREHLEQALALHEPDAGCLLSPLMGADPGAMGRAILGTTLWMLGYPDQGQASLRHALAEAQASEQPPSMAFAHLMAGMAYSILGRDAALALGHAQALRPLVEAGLHYGPWAELLARPAQAQRAPDQPPDHAVPGQSVAHGDKAALEHSLLRAAEAGSALQALGSGAGYAAQLLVQAQMCA